MADACGSCQAPVRWALTEADRRIPLDADPRDDGNLAGRRDEDGTIRVRSIKAGDPIEEDERRFVSHFATCPNAGKHRRRRG